MGIIKSKERLSRDQLEVYEALSGYRKRIRDCHPIELLLSVNQLFSHREKKALSRLTKEEEYQVLSLFISEYDKKVSDKGNSG